MFIYKYSYLNQSFRENYVDYIFKDLTTNIFFLISSRGQFYFYFKSIFKHNMGGGETMVYPLPSPYYSHDTKIVDTYLVLRSFSVLKV